MNAAAEIGRNPVSKHQIQPEYGDEQAEISHVGGTNMAHRVLKSSPQENTQLTKPRRDGPRGEI